MQTDDEKAMIKVAENDIRLFVQCKGTSVIKVRLTQMMLDDTFIVNNLRPLNIKENGCHLANAYKI